MTYPSNESRIWFRLSGGGPGDMYGKMTFKKCWLASVQIIMKIVFITRFYDVSQLISPIYSLILNYFKHLAFEISLILDNLHDF